MNRCTHRVIDITADGTNLILTVANSTNIGNNERFKFYFPRCAQRISNVVTGAPLPVLVNVNGVNVQLIDAYGRAEVLVLVCLGLQQIIKKIIGK